MSQFTRILVPLDDSPLAERVLDAAIGLAKASSAELVLLRVQAKAVALTSEEAAVDLAVIDQEVTTSIARARARPGAEGLTISAEVRAGDVVHAIHGAVEERLCDAVVMGNHGRDGIWEQFTGSTTEQVIAKVPASIFAVRALGYPFLRT